MSYKPVLSVRVEALGAVFYFQPPDRTMARLSARAEAVGTFDSEEAPEELIELMPDMFVEGVRHWEGVETADGEPLPCTEENRRGIPTEDKITVTSEYLLKLQEIARKPDVDNTNNRES